MDPELAALLRFLRVLGEVLGAAGFWGSLPIFAFIIWCCIPRRGP